MFLSTPQPPVQPPRSGLQRALLFTLLGVIVCLPLVLVSMLYAETYLPAFDRFTLAMPMSVRSMVAAGVLKTSGYGKEYEPKVRRALKIDPSSAEALGDVCDLETTGDPKPNAIADCKRAIDADPARDNWSSLARAQEKSGDVCTAAQSYETAHDKGSGGDSDDLRGMGRTELQCGHIPYSIAELLAARDLDTESYKQVSKEYAEDGKKADEAGEREDVDNANEWLSAAYSAANQPEESTDACLLAHPELKTCACFLVERKVRCASARALLKR